MQLEKETKVRINLSLTEDEALFLQTALVSRKRTLLGDECNELSSTLIDQINIAVIGTPWAEMAGKEEAKG